jgi:multisubunit Na+/H+ antiporter MnhG subunit
MRTIATDILLGAGVVLVLAAVAATVAMRDALDRLHFAGPASIGALLIAAAVLVRSGPSTIALKAGLLALFIVATAPVLAHFTARAIREWDRGTWKLEGDELERARR